jgi:hypothetical protein
VIWQDRLFKIIEFSHAFLTVKILCVFVNRQFCMELNGLAVKLQVSIQFHVIAEFQVAVL